MAVIPSFESIRASWSGHRADASQKQLASRPESFHLVPRPSDPHAQALGHSRLDDARFWLAAIADSSDDAMVGKDLNGIVTSWNKAAETMFGHTAAEIIGQPITRLIPSDRIEEGPLILGRVRRGEKIMHFETKRQCKDGRVIPVSLTLSPIRDDQGRIIGVSKTARDLSETQRVHRDLERREALLRSILDTVPDAMIVIDKQGFIHSFSVAAVRLFGHTSAEIMGQNINVLLPAPNWDHYNSHLAGYAATGDRHIIGFGQRKDGGTFPMTLAIGEVNLPGTRLFTAFVHDLTAPAERERELRAANTELERLALNLETARDVADRANWAKSRFLAGMSHELRTPLNGILGYAQLLRMECDLNPTQSERVAAILGAAKHLLQLVTRVLDVSEVDAEHVELQAVDLDVLTVATACLDLVRPAADAKRLALSIAVSRGTRQTVVSDPTRLRQILLSLLGNAVKSTEEGSVELRLRHVPEDQVLRIEVADTGRGIPASERRRLFRNFEDQKNDDLSNLEGSRLGLALSARLAALLGGCLGHHDNPNGGSVFWLELPWDAANGSQMAVQPAPEKPVSQDSSRRQPVALHVLVVDDVAMNRDIAGSFLVAAGHRVTCVEGGAEAVAEVMARDFDAVLMDVRMPEMDGLEATRRIRALEGGRGRLPIIALTAQAFTEQVSECRKAGMDSHVSKPFDPDTLVSAVLRACGLGSAVEEVSVPALAPAALPGVGSELLIFNPAAFERTAFFLAPEAVASYLEAIAARGESLLRGLRGPDALIYAGDELADAAHSIAGSAGMFGFERLTFLGRRFERAVNTGAAEAPALAESLRTALETTLQAIHDRTLAGSDA